MPETLIQLDHVSFAYTVGEQAVEDVSLQINQGDFVGLIGPNGSGKTTLLRLILGLLHPHAGTISLFGEAQDKFRDWYKVGYVPQRAIHIDTAFPVTVREIVSQGRTAGLGLWRRAGVADKAAVDHALHAVGMAEYSDRLVRGLSGGQQQRVFIARALASEPDLLILDEPTVGVDIESQEDFYNLLAHLKRHKQLTLMMVSHDVDVVMQEVNRLVCINKKIVYNGSPAGFIDGKYSEKLYPGSKPYILHQH